MPEENKSSACELRVRCDETLHQQIADAAQRSLRSMTREVIYRLRTSLKDDPADRARSS
jgi:predicted HicB family RNase H-like nuclease